MKFLKKIFRKRGSSPQISFEDKPIVKDQHGNVFLQTTTVLVGEGTIYLTLKEQVHTEIKGHYSGDIIGTKQNVIKVSGTFSGSIKADHIHFQKGSITKGNIQAITVMIEEGAIMELDSKLG